MRYDNWGNARLQISIIVKKIVIYFNWAIWKNHTPSATPVGIVLK